MAEIGLIGGLAVDLQNNQKIQDLRYQEQQDRRDREEAAARARLLTDGIDIPNVMNSYDAPIVKENTRKLIAEMAGFNRENPDLMYNPEKLMLLKEKKNSILNNPDVSRALVTDQNYAQLVKTMQEAKKKPQLYDIEALQSEMDAYNNYTKFGHQGGEEAARLEGKKAFLFNNPRQFDPDLASKWLKMGNSVKNYDKIDGKNPGEFYTKMRDTDINALTAAAMEEDGRQIQVEAKKRGFTPEQTYNWVKSSIEAGFDKQHNLGDPTALRRLALQEAEFGLQKKKFNRELAADNQQAAPYTTWDDLMSASAAPVPLKTAYNIWGGKRKIQLTGDNGQKVDLSGVGDFKPDGMMYKPKTGDYKGVPHITGYVELPFEEAVNRGLVKEQSSFNPFDEDAPAAGFGNKVKIVQGEHNGKPYKYVKIDYEMAVDPKDATAKSMYESDTMPTKFVEKPQNQQPQRQPVTASKQDFINAGYTEEQIQRGVREGLINLK